MQFVCLQSSLQEDIDTTQSLHDGQDDWGVFLPGCGMRKRILHGEFSGQGKNWNDTINWNLSEFDTGVFQDSDIKSSVG
jgi:hypothetical protein